MLPRTDTGLTRVEFVVVLGIILTIIYVFFVPHFGQRKALIQGQTIQTLSSMKQLHLATRQMALDGESTKNPALGWPGDTGGSFAHWATTLVKGNYLATNDLAKLLSAPGKFTPPSQIPTTNDNATLVYAVRSNSLADALMFSTANFINSPNGGTLNTNARPYCDKGFVIFHRDGSGEILFPRQAGHTNFVGSYVPLCH